MMAEPEETSLDVRLDMLIPHDYLAAASSERERLILAVNYFKEQMDVKQEDLQEALLRNTKLAAEIGLLRQRLVDVETDLKRYTTLKLN